MAIIALVHNANEYVRNNPDQPCTVWLSFAGHGSNVRDRGGDEVDGRDECILPNDFRAQGVITDDVFAQLLVPLDPKVRAYVFVDSCHSGTMLDLQYTLNGNGGGAQARHKTMMAHVVCISACLDTQVAQETPVGGAMTLKLLECLTRYKNPTYAQLIATLRTMTGQSPLITSSRPILGTHLLY